jgi:hypothetical protein
MKTSDVYLSAALLALGYKLSEIDRTDPRHMVFGFLAVAETGSLGELSKAGLKYVETEWANRTLVVNAFDFAEAIKRMKSLIHSS